ncbi:MAG: 50S ribosomal protein L32 [Candidatus Omnitrophica bacterium]|nr:50S ribosomal protein L32 [Candidatus Omnitrophota bacterium]
MALPKRRFSRARRDKRRSQQHVAGPTLTTCPQCGGSVVAHHACPACGTYRGRQVLAVKAQEKDQA